MMEKYQTPELEFISFSARDIITTSGNPDKDVDELPNDEW